MPFPTDDITENVFLDPTTETVSSGWSVFKKMKDAIKGIIASRGAENGIPSLDGDTKIPIAQIPDEAVNPDLSAQFSAIKSNSNSDTSPANPAIGQTWFKTSDNALSLYTSDGWKPVGGGGMSLVNNTIYRTTTTVTLEKGTYLLIPVGGDGSTNIISNGTVAYGLVGNPSTVTLDGFTASGSGGSISEPCASTMGLFGGKAAGGVGNLITSAYTSPHQMKTITSEKVATITIGLGGERVTHPSGTQGTPGAPGWCVIWKLG